MADQRGNAADRSPLALGIEVREQSRRALPYLRRERATGLAVNSPMCAKASDLRAVGLRVRQAEHERLRVLIKDLQTELQRMRRRARAIQSVLESAPARNSPAALAEQDTLMRGFELAHDD